ncbi:MAG TPA: translation initiation factor IF-3 [Candidatus Paceibacterota bacterium]|nr:translation initiation factor IF-3 [Candidatus Paceibacterota bacterium]
MAIPKLRVNHQIRLPEVQVIDQEGKQLGVMKTSDALKLALDGDLDLVEVGPNSRPPIAKLMDYGKYQYQKSKEAKAHGRAPKQETKAVRVGFKTGEHDLAFKAKKADEFLQAGHIVKIELTLRGREKAAAFAQMGRQKLLDFVSRLQTPVTAQGQPNRGPYGWVLMIQRDKKAAQKTKNHGKTQEQEGAPEAREGNRDGEGAQA